MVISTRLSTARSGSSKSILTTGICAAAAAITVEAAVPTTPTVGFVSPLPPTSPPAGCSSSRSSSGVDFTAFAAMPSTPPPSENHRATSARKKATTPSSASKTRKWNVVTPDTKMKTTANKKTKGVSSAPSKKKSSKSKKNEGSNSSAAPSPITRSFGALTAAKFPNLNDKEIEVHTLVLGTHPSVQSLEESQYYGHPMNAFWWIAGDCLGFRRGTGVSAANGKPYQFTSQLKYDDSHILSYEQQIELFCSKGFALWDIVASCERPGSLDMDITKDVPNDVPGFCKQHPSIRRIVLANGTSGCTFFKRHYKAWLDSGHVVPNPDNSVALTEFRKWVVPKEETHQKITIISALAVSPAAARHTYPEKRNFWDEHVYRPGIASHEKMQRAGTTSTAKTDTSNI